MNYFIALILFAFSVTARISAKTVAESPTPCRYPTDHACRDGTCVSTDRLCDGIRDCLDGSDETSCGISLSSFENPPLGRVKKQVEQVECNPDERPCSNGTCIDLQKICDGVADCFGGEDESLCNEMLEESIIAVPSLIRSKRQTSCRKDQWRCKDGTCVSIYSKCDGLRDCPDGSDETFALCRNNKCQSNWFRCTYGACVNGDAACNKVKDCVDNSDELLPRCRNQTYTGTKFKCDDGQEIPAFNRCDGVSDCRDGSDETVRVCSGKTCQSHLFQCAYGACVDGGSECNGQQDCADGSDESNELCNRLGTDTGKPVLPPPSGACKLPPYPNHGTYAVQNVPTASPGQSFASVFLNITCYPGYGVIGTPSRLCLNGVWSPSEEIECVRFCRLQKDPSVRYRCLYTGNSKGSRECEEFEPDGTVVRSECNIPNYYYTGVLQNMHCIDGNWDYIARCTAECGRVVPEGVDLIVGGRPAERGELPWHAGIYRTTTTPYMQICGGSLVSAKVVISAAHCFWNDTHKAQPPSNYAVALGKLYRPWAFKGDADVQRSGVADIKIPQYFLGGAANFQADIALLILTTTIEYRPHIRPVCVDFNIAFENIQLSPPNKGKVAGWGLTAENGDASPFLKVVELPYISLAECQTSSPVSFREYITADKMCAGYRNGTALCKGDSGGGLTFPTTDHTNIRYYLRGIVSTAPNNDNLCNANWLTTFTLISKHEYFITEVL